MGYLDSLSKSMMDMIATEQGQIFEYAESKGYDMNDFIQKYMNSAFCNREMDSECSFFHFKPAEVCFPYIEKECNLKKSVSGEYNDVGWTGMMYRYLVYKLNISSKKLITILPSKELDNMVYAYELVDTDEAISQIIQKLNLA